MVNELTPTSGSCASQPLQVTLPHELAQQEPEAPRQYLLENLAWTPDLMAPLPPTLLAG
jgi:hypothetical protein